MTEYGAGSLIGAAVGIMIGVVLVAILLKFTKKDGSLKCKYDERQEIARGKGFKYAFFTVIIYMAFEVFFGEFMEQFAERSVLSFVGLSLGVGVYAVYAIMHDAYISLNENPRRVDILFLVVAVINIAGGMRYFLFGDFQQRGVVGIGGINLICGILMAVVWGAMKAKQIRGRREAD